MDFEALTDFQQRIMGLSEVIVVSPAPVFGVKLIEIIQRIFTFFGQPLLVDAGGVSDLATPAHRAQCRGALVESFRHR